MQNTPAILYAEDDPGQARLVQRHLKKHQYSVVVATTVAEALRAHEKNPFDVVVTDYRMADGDGLDLIRALRAGGGESPCIIMMSVISDLSVAVKAMKLGAADFLVKDAEGNYLNLLPGAIHRVLELKGLQQSKQLAEQAIRDGKLTQSIISSAPFSIVATNHQGEILAINPAAQRMLLYGKEELVGKSNLFLLHDPEEIALRARDLSDELGESIEPGFEVLAAKARQGFDDVREWTYIRKDGSRLPVYLTVTALRGTKQGVIGFLAIAYDITERKRTEEYIQQLAQFDHLTRLPNRLLLQDRMTVAIGRAKRFSDKLGVMMVDLDHFKRINDSLGHYAGDQLLVEVAKRLELAVRKTDTVARMGGDEFVVLLPDVKDTEDLVKIGMQIVQQVSGPVRVGSHELHVTPSVGIAVCPDDGDDPLTLLKNADTAMYVAKGQGRNSCRLFTREMARNSEEKLVMEEELRRAIERNEFCLFFQPLVSLSQARVSGVEALLRWNHPEAGLTAPGRFISLAEETGLIVPIGEWVLREACRAIREIQSCCGDDLQLAVNLSPCQFLQHNLVEMVADNLAATGLNPFFLELEITEGVLMADNQRTDATLQQFRDLGVRVAVDDFGTGFSSLSYVTRFPIDRLKIDQSFVAQLGENRNSAAVISAIIAMAHGMGIKVIAEGVETSQQLAFLIDHGTDCAQGYFFAKPTPESGVSTVIKGVNLTLKDILSAREVRVPALVQRW